MIQRHSQVVITHLLDAHDLRIHIVFFMHCNKPCENRVLQYQVFRELWSIFIRWFQIQRKERRSTECDELSFLRIIFLRSRDCSGGPLLFNVNETKRYTKEREFCNWPFLTSLMDGGMKGSTGRSVLIFDEAGCCLQISRYHFFNKGIKVHTTLPAQEAFCLGWISKQKATDICEPKNIKDKFEIRTLLRLVGNRWGRL